MATVLTKEAAGPAGDEARHLPIDALETRYAALAAPPTDRGRVRLLVRRRADGERELPDAVRLTVEDGLDGDGWSRRPPRDPNAQITAMRHDVAELIANGQAASTFGDNVLVELDLSAENLPAGTRIEIGECLVEVTPEPHNGCAKFAARFGGAALRFINLKPLRSSRLRGIHWRVLRSGAVAVGDEIVVLSRPAGE
jgi:MOSC domain-containing protein YiiM